MFEIFYLGSIFTAFATIYLLLFKENAIRSYADYLLSFYFIFIVWTAVLYLILDNGQIINYPYLYKTAAPINFIIFPIGYLYVRSILYNEKRFTIKDIWHFIPFFLMVINYAPFYILTFAEKRKLVVDVTNNLDLAYQYQTGLISENIIYFFRIFQTGIYLFFQFQLVYRFKKNYKVAEIQKHVSDVLKWLRIFNWANTASYLALVAIAILVLIYNSLFTYFSFINYLPSFLYSLSFFVLSTYILTHQNILTGFPFVQYKESTPSILDNEVNKIPFIKEDYSVQIEQIDSYFKSSKPYLNNNLTIGHISVALNIPIRELSYIINNYYKQRFSDLINSYRLKYIIEKFNESYLDNFTIESMAMEAGFNSKSAFYKSFHKFYNTTPSKFFGKINMN
jgi:AraC-like DNA-binding protein